MGVRRRQLRGRWVAALALAVAAALGACSSPTPEAAPSVTTVAVAPTVPSADAAEPVGTVPDETTTTTIDPAVWTPLPAHPAAPGWLPTSPDFDVPNPLILARPEHYVMFSSNTELPTDAGPVDFNVPFRYSDDLSNWSLLGEALPVLPPWAEPGWTWAPDLLETDDGWVLFFSARLAGTELQCIGHAVADRLEGPYTPFDAPIVCPTERGGAIDPRTVVDGDEVWLLWKTDDNWDLRFERTTSLMSQRLDPTGTALVGEPTTLLDAGGGWEGHIVEAPDMAKGPDGRWWLFYSGGWFNQPVYGIAVAACDSPAGPCARADRPMLTSNDQGSGPGEGSIFVDRDGSVWLAYAPWAQRYRTPTPRPLALARIGFGDGGPYLGDPAR